LIKKKYPNPRNKNYWRDYGLIGLVVAGMAMDIGLAQLLLTYFQNPIF